MHNGSSPCELPSKAFFFQSSSMRSRGRSLCTNSDCTMMVGYEKVPWFLSSRDQPFVDERGPRTPRIDIWSVSQCSELDILGHCTRPVGRHFMAFSGMFQSRIPQAVCLYDERQSFIQHTILSRKSHRDFLQQSSSCASGRAAKSRACDASSIDSRKPSACAL